MNSLLDSTVSSVIAALHEEASRDSERRAARAGRDEKSLIRMGEMYLAVSRQEAELLYLLVRGSNAKCIIEFGSSFGISTIYLAAAAKDNGGRVISTEVHPEKCKACREVVNKAGLDDVATVIEGDARETLKQMEGPFDFLFLDGWKSQYLPVLKILIPKLNTGALVVADNIDHEGAKDYAAFVRSSKSFVSSGLGKQELSCYLG